MSKNDKKNSSDKKTLVVIAVVLVLLLIGGTYAWLQITVSGTKTNILRAGKLSLKLNDELSNGISLKNTVPMSDTKGMKTPEYTFTLTNDGTVESYYTIYLDDVALGMDEKRMEDKFVKYALEKVTPSDGTTTAVPTLLTASNINGERVLDSGVIKAGETNSYKLQLWINSTATTEVMNTIFYGKIRVEATQKSDFIVQDAKFTSTGVIIPFLSSENVNNITCQIGTSENDYTLNGTIDKKTCVVDNLVNGQTYYYNMIATKTDGKTIKQKGSFTFVAQ